MDKNRRLLIPCQAGRGKYSENPPPDAGDASSGDTPAVSPTVVTAQHEAGKLGIKVVRPLPSFVKQN